MLRLLFFFVMVIIKLGAQLLSGPPLFMYLSLRNKKAIAYRCTKIKAGGTNKSNYYSEKLKLLETYFHSENGAQLTNISERFILN